MWVCIGMYLLIGIFSIIFISKKKVPAKYEKMGKQILILLLVFTTLAFLSELSVVLGKQGKSTVRIKRNGYGEGQKEETLSMQIDGEDKQEVKVQISSKKYSAKEIEKLAEKAEDVLAKEILGKNQNFSHVEKDLVLETKLDGFPFTIGWEFSRYDLMDMQGKLDYEKIREADVENQGIRCRVTAKLRYENQEYPCDFEVVIFAGDDKDRTSTERVQELIKREDKLSQEEEYLVLPGKIDGKKIKWNQEMKSNGTTILMFGILISILLVGRKVQNEKNQMEIRKTEMMLDYPEIITQFTMLTGAGMTAKNVWKKIAEDYNGDKKRTGRKRAAYEEIWYTWQEMQSGIPEGECYERFARRCDLIPYMKMGALLSQNLRKGAKGMSEILRMEAVQALEDRKSRARQLGEEAGTKLLLPMLLMLIIVITIVVVPAFLSIQI